MQKDNKHENNYDRTQTTMTASDNLNWKSVHENKIDKKAYEQICRFLEKYVKKCESRSGTRAFLSFVFKKK